MISQQNLAMDHLIKKEEASQYKKNLKIQTSYLIIAEKSLMDTDIIPTLKMMNFSLKVILK